MKIATSILGIKDQKDKIRLLRDTSTEYIHLDVMDGRFVSNKVDLLPLKETILGLKKQLDIHFMVDDVESYIEAYRDFRPEYMTFHVEVKQDISKMLTKIHSLGIKAGLSINPNTDLEVLKPYLKQIDLLLIMSVEPGKGGQAFLPSSIERLHTCKKLRREANATFAIEMDGGINADVIQKLLDLDIAVSGNYITKTDDFEKQIRALRN